MVFNVPPRCPSDFSERASGVRLKNINAGVMELADVTDSKTNDLFGSSPLKNLDFTGFFSYH